MNPIDIPAIERQARALRAQEIQRLNGLFSQRLRLYALLLGNSLLSLITLISNIVRPAFSWNPQVAKTNINPPILSRLNDGARTLFSWNPQDRRC